MDPGPATPLLLANGSVVSDANPFPVKSMSGGTGGGAAATGGATPYHLATSLATNNATSVKGSAGTLYGLEVFNTSAATVYLKLYDKASAPSPASDTPVKVIAVPATSGAIGGVVRSYPVGIAFTLGIAYALVTGAGDTNNTAVGAGDVVALNLDYK
jgi:hypothetical protein